VGGKCDACEGYEKRFHGLFREIRGMRPSQKTRRIFEERALTGKYLEETRL